MLLSSLLLVLCGMLPATAVEWKRVAPELELTFPADHGAHPAYRTEWWYVTGQVETEAGRRFGFQFTVFRRGMGTAVAQPGDSPLRARQVLLGHLALTDVEEGRTRFAERLRRTGSPLAAYARDDLALFLEDWSLERADDGRLRLGAGDAAAGFELDLELAPRKPLVLHGKGGYSAKGSEPGNASAYASWTRLATSGRVVVDGTAARVQGEGWFDHEFGTSVLEPGIVGWDWFGLQLADGRELMLFLLRRADGSFGPASAGTLVAADGSQRALAGVDFRIEPRGRWTSPRTGAVYPAAWEVTVAAAGLRFEVVPLVADSELGARNASGEAPAYWEGPVEVRGAGGGRGYAELTGYAGSMEGRF